MWGKERKGRERGKERKGREKRRAMKSFGEIGKLPGRTAEQTNGRSKDNRRVITRSRKNAPI